MGFESQKTGIDTQIAELRAMRDGGPTQRSTTPDTASGKRRKMSAAARKRMSEGQRKRWAESKGVAESPSAPATPEPSKPKRKLSAAGRKAISEANKKRWAAIRAAAKKVQAKKAKVARIANKLAKTVTTA